jgi:transketolase
VPVLDRAKCAPADGLHRGAYVLTDAPGGTPDVLLLATGSEVSLAMEAYDELRAEGIAARVVSMPSWEVFESHYRENPGYREEVLPGAVRARVSVEQAATFGWERYVGLDGRMVGMHTFGASAPLKELVKKFGFTPEAVAAAARDQVAKARGRGLV